MSPITKLWLSILKTNDTITTPEFHNLLPEILTHCASYTNPTSDPNSPPMHAFFQNIDNPVQILMITGYPTQEMNTAADVTYAQKYLSRVFQLVEHGWLKQLDLDVRSLPLDSDEIVLRLCDAPQEPGTDGAVGAWDVWPQTEQGIRMRQSGGFGEEKTWVEVSDGSQTGIAEVLRFRKIEGVEAR
ncbi:hypothetical protein BDV28DRAFT_145349 [Aspergillus coremiiformis]|uniref:Uncharacterized protein n=1 Tax=Aspergillus coremiiformis TaxID=138285 RepID=A0A5N6ZF59_9EURO|nr:hypothetical protein BDV28DRAFT_145349 [Aspergillus coremiiformis]